MPNGPNPHSKLSLCIRKVGTELEATLLWLVFLVPEDAIQVDGVERALMVLPRCEPGY